MLYVRHIIGIKHLERSFGVVPDKNVCLEQHFQGGLQGCNAQEHRQGTTRASKTWGRDQDLSGRRRREQREADTENVNDESTAGTGVVRIKRNSEGLLLPAWLCLPRHLLPIFHSRGDCRSLLLDLSGINIIILFCCTYLTVPLVMATYIGKQWCTQSELIP